MVIFSEGLCRIAEQYLKKGSKVYLEGQLQTRKWQDQSGQEKYTTEVVLQGFNSQLTMLDRAGDRGEFGSADNGADFGSSGPSREKQPAMAGAGGARRHGRRDPFLTRRRPDHAAQLAAAFRDFQKARGTLSHRLLAGPGTSDADCCSAIFAAAVAIWSRFGRAAGLPVEISPARNYSRPRCTVVWEGRHDWKILGRR